MFSEECAEAILKNGVTIEGEDLHAYELVLGDGTSRIWISKLPPNLEKTVEKNVDKETGEVRPCFVTTRFPYFQMVRADTVLSIREVLPRELALLMTEEDEG